MAEFDVQGARAAGYSPREIADFLGRQSGLDTEAARSAGWSDDALVEELLRRGGARPDAVPARPARGARRQRGSAGQEAARSLGVGARGAMQMVGALPGALYDVASLPVRGVAALTGLPQPRSSGQLIDAAADALGLPEAETSTERVINRVGTEVGAAVAGLGAGRALGRLAAIPAPARDRGTRGVAMAADILGGSPGAQVAGGVGAGVAGGVTSELAPDTPLADFGAALAGGMAGSMAVPVVQGAARGAGATARMFTQGGIDEAAASALLRASDDPQSLPARLRREYRGIEGSAPTAGELAGDSGLLQLERAVRSQPEGGPAFAGRDQARDAVRAGAIDALAPRVAADGPGAEEVARGVAAAGQRVADAAAIGERSAGRRVTGALRDLPAGRVAEVAGPQIREVADPAYDAARRRTLQAFGAVDPDGTSRLRVEPILEAGEETAKRLFRPLGGEIPPRLLDVFDRIRNYIATSDTAPFDNLSALRSDLADLQGLFGGSASASNSRALAVVSAMKQALDDQTRRASLPFERPSRTPTFRDLDQVELAEAQAQHPDVDAALRQTTTAGLMWGRPGQGSAGPSLIAYLRSMGGLNPNDPDLRGYVEGMRRYPGLLNRNGQSLHLAMERAAENGYLPQFVGDPMSLDARNAFLEALDESLRGRHIYPGGEGAAGAAATGQAARVAAIQDLAEEVHRRGGVFQPDDPEATMRSILQRPGDPDVPTAQGAPVDPNAGRYVDPVAEGWAFTPEQAARYRAALDLRGEQGRLFERGAMGRILNRGEGGSRIADSVVAQQFFHAGDGAASDVRQFVEALGERGAAARALEGYAAQSLRDYALGPDGKVVASRVRSWLGRHAAALRQMPEVAARFRNVEDAARVAEAAAERGARDVAEWQRGAARYWLQGTEPEVAIRRALSAGNAEQNIRQLRVAMKGDAPALRGLRRAYVEEWLSRVQNTMAQHPDETARLRADQSRRFVEQTERAAAALFKPEEVAQIARIAQDFRSGAMVTSVGRAVGSNTAQNLASLRSMSTAHILGRMSQGLIRGDASGLPVTLARPLQFLLRQQEPAIIAALAEMMLDPAKAARLTERVSAQNLDMVRRYAERSAAMRVGEAAGVAGARAGVRALVSGQAGEAQRAARKDDDEYAGGGMVGDRARVDAGSHMLDEEERSPYRRSFRVPYTPEQAEEARDNISIVPAGVSGRRPRLLGGPDMQGQASPEGVAAVSRGIRGAGELAMDLLLPQTPADFALLLAAPMTGGPISQAVVRGLGRVGLGSMGRRAVAAGGLTAMDTFGSGEAGTGELPRYARGGRAGAA